MTVRLFLADRAVERFVADGRAVLDGDALVARGGALDGRRFALEPAVRVLGVAGGGPDPLRLAGRVRSARALRADGAELLGTSLVAGDAAYDVEAGYLATPDVQAAARLAAAGEQESCGGPLSGPLDTEALARFLLKSLS